MDSTKPASKHWRTRVEREVQRDHGAGRHGCGRALRQRERLAHAVEAFLLAAHGAHHVGDAPARVVRLRGRQDSGDALLVEPLLRVQKLGDGTLVPQPEPAVRNTQSQ